MRPVPMRVAVSPLRVSSPASIRAVALLRVLVAAFFLRLPVVEAAAVEAVVEMAAWAALVPVSSAV